MKNSRFIFIIIIPFLIFSLLIYRLFIVSTSEYVDGYDLKSLETNIKEKKDVLSSKRGSILDSQGNVLAESVYTYRIIAYVDPKRSATSPVQAHVSDVEQTSSVIGSIVGEDKSNLEEILNTAITSGLTQTYLGTKSSNISVNQKVQIEEYNLPGIEFEEKESRSYPYGDFASYQVGYAKYYEASEDHKEGLVGELGVERSFNEMLQGKDGLHEYIADANGTRIPNTAEKIIEPVDGSDVYLTIDKDIQLVLENAISKINEEYKPEVALVVVASAKTGEILGVTSTPSFNPNEKDMVSYTNPLHEMTIEPGSTMKTFTYASAIEEGVYDPNYRYNTSGYTVHDKTIYDWNKIGWGTINLETGYMYSSNTGSAIIGYEKLGKEKLHSYHNELGFGKLTNFDLPGEVRGDTELEYDIDTVTASFGQGISITPIQMIQALTVFGTNGSTMQPYIVEKVVDSKGNIVEQAEPTVSNENVYSPETISYMKEMMRLYVEGPNAMSENYKFPEYGLFGKTGTSQIADNNGNYLTGANNYTFSFTGMMPYEDPEIIVYGIVKQPEQGASTSLIKLMRDVIPNVGEIMDISVDSGKEKVKSETAYMGEYIDMNVEEAKSQIHNLSNNEVIILGDGSNVVGQYPPVQTALQSYSRIYLFTDGEITMPNLVGKSYRDAAIIMSFYGIEIKKTGVGNVSAQSIEIGASLNGVKEVTIELK
ncbi:MAG: penicillin-binding transpeptidase domain-containing protein [Bacilli bacterium]